MSEIADRAGLAGDERFSILTTVYQNTQLDYFRITVASLKQQTRPFFEWIILAHGPISDELDAELQLLAEGDTRFRVFRRPINLGIVGGMSLCLTEALGDYIVPMDADDVLAEQALETLAAAINANGRPAMVYSDEDILVENQRRDAYRRPDWDEVLNLASSYIWHLCAIRRDAAHEAGLYSNSDAEWCHDWDTAFRISAIGATPLHVPAVLYHWRHHPSSSTNRPDPDSGSRRSTRALLEATIARQANPEHFEVADFPLFRGAPEWSIRRKPVSPPPVLGVSLCGRPVRWQAPMSRTIILGQAREKQSFWHKLFGSTAESPSSFASSKALAGILATADEPFVAICGGTEPADEIWFYEAIGLLELHANAVAVHGPIVDAAGHVLRGAEVFARDGTLLCPLAGKDRRDAGPFALMHKPHCVAVVPTDFFFCRTEALRAVLAKSDALDSLGGLGFRLGGQAQNSGLSIAYSPLIRAVATSALVDGNPRDAALLARKTLSAAERCEMGRMIRGAAGFFDTDRHREK